MHLIYGPECSVLLKCQFSLNLSINFMQFQSKFIFVGINKLILKATRKSKTNLEKNSADVIR